MEGFVWVSDAPSDSSLADGFTKSDLQSDGDARVIEISKVAKKGGIVPEAELPSEIWGEVGPYRSHHFPNYWPEIAYYSGLWIISAAVADILRRFDLGGGAIRQVRRFEKDQVTPVAGDWFCWSIGNVKEAFVAEHSANLYPAGGRTWHTLSTADHELKCSATAQNGADVWIDPLLRGKIFLAAELGQALIDAGFANQKAGWGILLKVDIIEP